MSDTVRRPWLVFRLGYERLAVLLERVDEIHAACDLEPAPDAPAAVCGLLDTGGGRLPVVDLRRRLEFTDVPVVGRRPRVVAVRAGGRRFGLLVDKVERPLALPETAVRPLPSLLCSAGAEHLTGLVALRQGWLILLDVDRLIRAPGSVPGTPPVI